MKNIALLIAILTSLATVPVAQAQRWDLIEDFSTTSNTQGDIWTYANGAPGVNEVTLKEMFDNNFHGDAWIPGPAQGAWSIDETDECCGYFAYNSSNVDQTFGIAGPVASGEIMYRRRTQHLEKVSRAARWRSGPARSREVSILLTAIARCFTGRWTSTLTISTAQRQPL